MDRFGKHLVKGEDYWWNEVEIVEGEKVSKENAQLPGLTKWFFQENWPEKNEHCKKDFWQDRAEKVHSNVESAEIDTPHDTQVEMSSICALISLSFNIEETWIFLDSR